MLMGDMGLVLARPLHEANRFARNAKKKQIKKLVRQYIKAWTKKEPMIVPILIEI